MHETDMGLLLLVRDRELGNVAALVVLLVHPPLRDTGCFFEPRLVFVSI